jgi:hypothetical protein
MPRQRRNNFGLDEEDSSLESASTHSIRSEGAAPGMSRNSSTGKLNRIRGNVSPMRVNRRQSRLPPSVVAETGSALVLMTMDTLPQARVGLNLSNHSRGSSASRRQRHSDRQRSRSAHARYGRNNKGDSNVGGEKDRLTASEDDSWQMFKEALQNMA